TQHLAYRPCAGLLSYKRPLKSIALADPEAQPATVARYYALLGRNAWGIGDSDGAFDAYRHPADLVPPEPPSAVLARVLAEEARGLMLMSRYGEAERAAVD